MSNATAPAVLAVLQQKDVTLADVIAALRVDTARNVVQAEPKVTLPRAVAISTEQQVLLKRLANIVQETPFPTVRRELTAAERRKFIQFTEDAKTVKALAEKLLDQLKATWFNHFDLVAEVNGRADNSTARDKYGWLLVEDKNSGSVTGVEKKVTREYNGGTVDLPADRLAELEEQGVLTHEEYLRVTRPARMTDEDELMKFLAERPELIPAVAASAVQTRQPSCSLYVRKV